MLFLAGSEKTLNFIVEGLQNTKKRYGITSYNSDGGKRVVLQCDDYIELVTNWDINSTEYDFNNSESKRISDSKEFCIWLTKQSKLIKKKKKHEIKTDFSKTNTSGYYQFIDTP